MNMSERLKEMVDKAASGEERCVYLPELLLVNPDTEYEFKCNRINHMLITQDFYKTYMDTIQVSIEINQKQLKEMLTNIQGLEASLILRAVDDIDMVVIDEQEPIIIETKVLIENQGDINKQGNVRLFENEEGEEETVAQIDTMFPYTLHLIEPDIYDIRHMQLNTMFNDVDVEKILHWSCQQFGAENTIIIPPNNNQVYSNLTIPPMHDIGSLYPYLQERYGIYAKGLGYYFTDKTMYIYPIFDYDEDTKTVDDILHILHVSPDYYAGMSRYHNQVDTDIFVLSNVKSIINTISSTGSENHGNVHMSVNAETLKDSFVTVDKDGKITRNKDDIATLSVHNNKGNMSKDMQNIRYKGERSNIYVSTSEMAMYDGAILTTGWRCAVPRLLKPGQNVVYHYDAEQGDYRTQNGRILSVEYMSTMHESAGLTKWFTFQATMSVFLEPDNKDNDEVQYVQ